MIILNLLLTAGVYWHTILYTIVLEVVYVVLLFIGSITVSTYKWGYFTLAIFVLGLVLENICWAGFRHARAIGGNIAKLYYVLAPSIFVLWILYPISWGVSEAGNVIQPDSEQIFYGILDLLSKPILGAVLLAGHSKIDLSQLDLKLYDRAPVEPDVEAGNAADNEKAEHLSNGEEPPAETPAPATANGATANGATANGEA